MYFFKKIQQILAADIIDIKPQLKEKKAKDKAESLKPRFDKAKVRVLTSSTYAYPYELKVSVPVPALFIRDKKKDNTGNFVQLLHAYVDKRIGIWMGPPTLGGLRDRAKGGMLNVEAVWYFEDAYLAYALGLDLDDWSGSADVVDKPKITARMNLAEKAMKELQGFRDLATKKIKLRTQDKEEGNKIWKEDFMEDWVALDKKWRDKGISYTALIQHERDKKRAFGCVEKIHKHYEASNTDYF